MANSLSMPLAPKGNEVKGLVFDVQPYSVHDGPGCRTLFFLSGCPLKCTWCANPEGWQVRKRLLYTEAKCKHIQHKCTRCIDRCKKNAVQLGENNLPILNRALCEKCTTYECAEACKEEAIRVSGKELTLDDFIKIVKRDRQFWSSNGGVTFTGGEPMLQKDFLLAALKYCKEAYIHTAIETCSGVPSSTLREVMPYLDFMFMDLKNMDDEKHTQYTGVSNKGILQNIRIAAGDEFKGRVVIRIPVIPGFNDNEKNMRKTAQFMNEVGLQEVNLLPFHRMGDSKWRQLGMEYPFTEEESRKASDLVQYVSIFNEKNILCYLGSETPF